MESIYKAVKVSDHVYWVGAIDWAVRDMHGYQTSRGTTYNAYLVMADKITLVDTVKAPFRDVMLSRIASVVDPARIDYIVSNHAEMDHTGCLPDAVRICKPEKVFASKMGVKALRLHFHGAVEPTEVAEGETLPLGNMNLTFLETRMLHWPDSMVSYLDADRLLFTQDGFGMHLATEERFADQIERETLRVEAAKYFANILLPFSRFATAVLDKLEATKLPVDVVAPDHGPIYRGPESIGFILQAYRRWAAQKRLPKAVVTYATMWGSTSQLAHAIAAGAGEAGATVRFMPLAGVHRSDIATELLDAGGLVVGSPTINGSMFPTVADALSYMKGLKPAGLLGFAFGSFGWSGEGAKFAQAILKEMSVDLFREVPVVVNYVPDGKALAEAKETGRAFGAMLVERFGR